MEHSGRGMHLGGKRLLLDHARQLKPYPPRAPPLRSVRCSASARELQVAGERRQALRDPLVSFAVSGGMCAIRSVMGGECRGYVSGGWGQVQVSVWCRGALWDCNQ